MNSDHSLPSPGVAEVHVIAATPEVARRVAQAIRHCFISTEQCSYPVGRDEGTVLRITVDTTRAPASSGRFRPWLRHGSLDPCQPPPRREGVGSISTAAQPGQPLPARLALSQPEGGMHRINGSWWPRSHDLTEELPALLMALGPRWGGATRITVDRTMWRPGPEQLQLAGRTVHIARSHAEGSRQSICLLAYGIGRCDLLVVPPETSPEQARRLMAETCEQSGATHSCSPAS